MSGALNLNSVPKSSMKGLSLSSKICRPGSMMVEMKMDKLKIKNIASMGSATGRIETKKQINLYEVLQVKETASKTEIKTAYRSLVKRYHPDAISSRSDGRDFMEIHEAYVTLSDPVEKAKYDASLSAARRLKLEIRSGFGYGTKRWETDQCW